MSKVFHFCCWRPLPGNFCARRRFSFLLSLSTTPSFMFIFVGQLSAPSVFFSTLSPARKFVANLDFCIFISSGFGFNVVPRKLPKFNRVNDKVFSLLSLLCLPFFLYIINNANEMRQGDNDNKRCEQKLRSHQVLNLASVQSWPCLTGSLNNGLAIKII